MVLQWILDKISWDYNKKQLEQIRPLVEEINTLAESWDWLTDEEIQAKTPEFKARLEAGEQVDDILVEAFATVKQACKRMVGDVHEVKGDEIKRVMVPYDVQILGAIVLHQGKNAEMRTGEWKTLVATMPAYLNALTGKWVHVVTVNDYLASRDAEWMGYLYEWLGLTVWAVTKGDDLKNRRSMYEKDITYVENSELWFDYLRDNLTKTLDERNLLWRPLHYAIIDEVDSILIDEARTPLIISHPSDEPTEKYEQYAKLVKYLKPSTKKKKIKKWFLKELLSSVQDGEQEEEETGVEWDYYIEEKTKSVSLTSAWIAKLEELLEVDNLYKHLGYDEIHHIENALKANAVYIKDKDYLIKDNQVMIVDQNTGRTMPWRRYSQWLHQAIEAKEGMEIQRESKTLASITYQHFFKQYEKLSGMTGTALTEAEEFEEIYDLEVLSIPTNEPIIRVDKGDSVYYNQDAKWNAVADHIKFYHTIGQPILIGTSSIHTSELMSSILKKMALHHTVLNAKFHEKEASIVKNAGKKGSVVVATNMAWRGTDIKLEPWLDQTIAKNYAGYIAKMLKKWKGFSGVVYSSTEYEWVVDAIAQEFGFDDAAIDKAVGNWIKNDNAMIKIQINTSKKEKEQAFAEIICKPASGEESDRESRDFHFWLYILGTEKHDSRRIDNQLRWRAWRQWDPGVSQFFVAMDDEIMRKMWGDKIQSVARMLLSADDLKTMAFTQKQFTNSIKKSQKQMEWRHFGVRKHLFDYDSVINKQRERIYAKRDEILAWVKDKLTELEWADTANNDANNNAIDTSWSSISKSDTSSDTSSVDASEQVEIIELSVIDEIKYFIDEVVDDLVKGYTAVVPWNLTELLESLQSITGATFLEEEYADIWSARKLKRVLKDELHEIFDTHIAGDTVDQEDDWHSQERAKKILEYAKKVYLNVIDRNWMQHITDMQYLREKVGLYGYAQLDPLVIYKQEAYTKFQTLLATIRKETLWHIMRTDFSQLDKQQPVRQTKKINMASVLKAVTEWLKNDPNATQHAPQKTNKNDSTVIDTSQDWSWSGDWSGDTSSAWTTVDRSDVDDKLRPNDRIHVRYADGSEDKSVKYKKVKKQVDAWKVTIVSK